MSKENIEKFFVTTASLGSLKDINSSEDAEKIIASSGLSFTPEERAYLASILTKTAAAEPPEGK